MRGVINNLNVTVEKCNACYYSIPHNEGVNSRPCKQPAQLLITVSNYHAITRPIAARPRLSIVETAKIFENHSHYEKESRFACPAPRMYVWAYWPVPSGQDLCFAVFDCFIKACGLNCGPVTTTCCTPLRIFASGCMNASSGCVPPYGVAELPGEASASTSLWEGEG